jgi:2-oxoglutarate ferredoxin oxidoreductase subunit beta
MISGRILTKPKSLTDVPTHYCAGCGHGIVHRIVAEVIDEFDIREKVVAVAPVGCAVLAYDYWNFDTTESAHGRCLAVATAIKRTMPDNIVFTYQGDGDLAAIGTAETIHAANRGENLTVIFVNNGVYAMTGGQMAPTTLIGQKTATTQNGRNAACDGNPLKVLEMLAVLDGVVYLERVSVESPQNILKTKRAIKKAFGNQLKGRGFSMVEVLSMCPTYTGRSVEASVRWIKERMSKDYPLGVYKDRV